MINIVVERKGIFYRSYFTTVMGERYMKVKLTRDTFSRDRMIDLIARKIKFLVEYETADIQLCTNIDTGFRYDLLFHLRNEYNIDLNKCA